jgi:hypothetical protein
MIILHITEIVLNGTFEVLNADSTNLKNLLEFGNW